MHFIFNFLSCLFKITFRSQLFFVFMFTVAAQAPYAIVSPKFLDLDFNSADNVTCTTFGNNNQVEWLRAVQINGQTKLEKVPTENILATFTLTPQGNYKREWTLMFRNVTESDAGSYMCKVTSDTKPTFREVDVAVKREFSHFLLSPSQYEI